MSLIAAGRVDLRLFNVSKLIQYRYDDSRPELPLVVTASSGASPAAGLAAARVQTALPSVGATAVRVKRQDAGAMWGSVRGAGVGVTSLAGGVERIALDAPVRPALFKSVPQIGAPAAWSAGYTGEGATVAVLDMGVDATHPDLKDAVVDSKDFSGAGHTDDGYVGHGTHVASTIAGSGAASPPGEVRRGVAPDANLLNGKVLDDDGSGYESNVVAGIEWAVSRGAKVINMSLGFAPGGTDNVVTKAVDKAATQNGVLSVVSAGNDGEQGERTITASPAAADTALTVGAVDGDNKLAFFSSRGPRLSDDGVKPEITGPGVDVSAANPVSGVHQDEGPYHTLSGTSMAAPHVSGVAALLAAAHPDWKADRLKAALVNTALPTPGTTVFQQGAGRVDAAKAVSQKVFSTSSTINYGFVPWPRADDVKQTRTVTYTNSGASAVTLNLSVDMRDQQGSPAPAGVFALNATTVTVPAGGAAGVVLTADTRIAPSGLYGGVLLAQGGGATVRIPVSVHAEATERHDLTVKLLDRDGKPTLAYTLAIINVDTGERTAVYGRSGTVTTRLPKGTYLVEADVVGERQGSDAGDGLRWDLQTVGIEPAVVLDKDVALTFDARQGRDVTLKVAKPEARQGDYVNVVSYDATMATGPTQGNAFFPYGGLANIKLIPSATKAVRPFRFEVQTRMAKPDGNGAFANSPYLYSLREVVSDGKVPAGLQRAYADSDLGRVNAVYHAPVDPAKSGLVGGMVDVGLPATVTEFYTPDQDWDGEFTQYTGHSTDQGQWQGARRYARGSTTTEHWNTAVVGPAFYYDPTGQDSAAQWNERQLAFGFRTHADGVFKHVGTADNLTYDVTLSRNGQQLSPAPFPSPGSGYFDDVPTGTAQFTAKATMTRDPIRNPLSTSITTEWTFTSGPAAPGTRTHVPILVPRLLPDTDTFNRAPSNTSFAIPVKIQKNGVANPVTAGITLKVEASYDDGKTWQTATIGPDGDRFKATVQHPAGPGFVSLRVIASEAGGTSVTETIIRAYALR